MGRRSGGRCRTVNQEPRTQGGMHPCRYWHRRIRTRSDIGLCNTLGGKGVSQRAGRCQFRAAGGFPTRLRRSSHCADVGLPGREAKWAGRPAALPGVINLTSCSLSWLRSWTNSVAGGGASTALGALAASAAVIARYTSKCVVFRARTT
eukprot:726450-Prorocentrum_minimum.AAC.3